MQKTWMIGLTSASLLCAMSLAAGAGPASHAGSLILTSGQTPAVEKAANRCWWQNGYQYCKIYKRKPRFQYGQPRPEELTTGSSAWWRAMDRENRGGFGRH